MLMKTVGAYVLFGLLAVQNGLSGDAIVGRWIGAVQMSRGSNALSPKEREPTRTSSPCRRETAPVNSLHSV